MVAAAIVAGILALPVAFFGWSAIHEMAHYLAARSFRKVTEPKFRIYPHVDDPGGFRWASVTMYLEDPPLTPRESSWVSAAPRIPDAVAVLLTPFAAFWDPPWAVVLWAILFGAGIVDLLVGSTGVSEFSDLRRWAASSGINPWILRLTGWGFGLTSATFTIALIAIHFGFIDPD